MSGGLYQAFIYLLAALVAVPLAKRLGLGSVIGYLLAGAIIGPYALRFVEGGGDVMHFAEFGVVMLLFLIGLELRPALLWQMRRPILGLGGLQVAGSALVLGVAAILCGLGWKAALAVGLSLAMSSTAIVLQSLGERGLMKTPAGESSFAVLLFQDIAVIPILAVMPLLALDPAARTTTHEGMISHLPGWQQALVVIAAVVAIVFVGRFLLRPFFRYIAGSRLREMFTATALFIVLAIALLSFYTLLNMSLGLHSIVLSHAVFNIAFVAMVVRTRLKNFDRSIVEASIDLGASEFTTFRRVTLPVIAPGVIAAALLAFTLSIDEFIIAYFTAGAGQGSTTFPMQIYAMIRFGVTPEINAIATIVIGFSFFLVLLSQRLNRGAVA